VIGDALFASEDHRLWLERRWGVWPCDGYALHVGMNPSTAGADTDDLTVRKDQEFTRRMGLGWMIKRNLGTLVSTDPNGLSVHGVTVCHPANLTVILTFARLAKRIVIATGKPPDPLLGHARALFRSLKVNGAKMECFGLTKDHWPKHSSRLAYATPLVEFVW
jgi:hypothetical protein